jgi:predicted PurR-regulated permease PerM
MAETPTRYTLDRVVRMVISAGVILAIIALLRYLSDVLIPFVVAVVLAYMLNPLVCVFEQKTKRRGLAVGLTLGGLTILGLALIVLLIPLIYGQVTRFGRDLMELRQDLTSAIVVPAKPPSPFREVLNEMSTLNPPPKSDLGWRELRESWRQFHADAATLPRSERFARFREAVAGTYMGDALEALVRYVQSEDFGQAVVRAAKRLAEGGWSVVTFAINLVLGLTALILVSLYLVFLLLDFPEFARTWSTFLPPNYRDPIVQFLAEFDAALRQYLRGQAVVSLLYGALLALGFWMMRLPMAVPLGLFLGLLSMVPYLQTVGLVPAILLAFMRSIESETSLLGSVLLTLFVFGFVQMLTDWLISPRVMGRATGLRPVVVLLGVFVWGKLLGFLGLLLAIPLTCLGIAYYRRYVLREARA